MPSSLAPLSAISHRDRLLAVADLLGIHPSGARMAWLLATPASELRRIVRDGAFRPACADHLASLAAFAHAARVRLDDPDPAVRARRYAAWRAWLERPSLPGPDGPVPPLDRLADAEGAAAAARDLGAAPDERRGPVTLRLVTLTRPAGAIRRAG